MLSLLTKRTAAHRVDLAILAEAHYDAVWRFCYRRLGPDLAPDAAQETFLTAKQRLHTLRPDADPKSWLFGIAHRTCLALRRKNNREESSEWLDQVPTDPWMHSIERVALTQAMKKLSTEHREVILLHEIEEFTYEDIAAQLEIPVGTVKSRLHHAMTHLRRLATPEGRPI